MVLTNEHSERPKLKRPKNITVFLCRSKRIEESSKLRLFFQAIQYIFLLKIIAEPAVYPSTLLEINGIKMNYNASSSWNRNYGAKQAVDAWRYWCSKRNGDTPQYWWISFVEHPVAIVEIDFDKIYPGIIPI